MTTAQFLDALRTVLGGDALREAEALAAETSDAQQLAGELVRRQLLTQEQADRLLAADAGQITAEAPLPKFAADSRRRPERKRDVRQPSGGGGGIVLLIVALVALLVCLPVVGVVGLSFLGAGFFMVRQGDAAQEVAVRDVMVAEAVAQVRLDEEKLEIAQRFDGDTFRLSRDGAHILHGSDGKFFVSELNSGKRLTALPPGRIPIGFTTDMPLEVATGGAGAIMPVYLNDGRSGRELNVYPGVRGPITRMQLLPAGDGVLFLRGADLIVYNFAAVKEPAPLLTLPEEPTDLAIARDGFSLLTGSDSGKVQLRSFNNLGKVVDYPGAVFGVTCVALAPNGKHVLAGCESSVLVWERDNPAKRLSFDQDDLVLCAAFSPDSRRILSGGKGGSLRLSNAETGELIAQFQHAVEITAVVFHPDGRRAISASKDKSIRVWNLPK